VIRADEVKARVLAEHAKEIARAERIIDSAITRCDEVGAEVVADVTGWLHQVVCVRLVEYYGEGGWHVTFERRHASDQRDDDATTFKLRPRHASVTLVSE